MTNSEQIKKPRKNRFWKWFKRILLLSPLILFAIFFADYRLNSRDFYSDEKIFTEYQPNSVMAEIVEKTAMTEHGKAMFYRGDPEVLEQTLFKEECAKKLIVIDPNGCLSLIAKAGWFSWAPVTTGKIYILKGSRPETNYYPVTGAHEMLHYAYYLLNSKEKKRINKLIETEFQKRQDDKDLIETIKKYEKEELNTIDELHSELGTQYRNLGLELENYYKQYFTNRLKVVELHEIF